MNNELINLLPPERERELTKDYVLRVGVVVAVLATALTLSAAILLVPTFVLLSGSVNAKKIYLASVESTLSSVDEAALSARLTALSNNAVALTALSGSPSASAVIREVLTISHPGIILSSFTYTPASPANKGQGALAISGSSATRDALRSYQRELQGAPFVLSAALPVSAYAKDSDITFTITVTLAP